MNVDRSARTAQPIQPGDSPPARGLTIRELGNTDAARWQQFVTDYPAANLYHTLLWRDVVRDVFGHHPVYLFAEEAGLIRGILPMFHVRFPLLGSKLISIPYDIGSGGALALDEAAEVALAEHAVACARDRKVGYLELRYSSPRAWLEPLGFQRAEPVIISEMILDGEEQVTARISKDHLHSVRKAAKRGVQVREAKSWEDYLSFYDVYLRVFRAFGTPPYGRRYFRALWDRLHPISAVRLLLAEVNGRAVGGLQLFCFGKNMVSKFAACLPEAVPLRVYNALYWEAIRLGLRLGNRRLSWGTATRQQRGLIEFKDHWGSRSFPAELYALPVRGRAPELEKYYEGYGAVRQMWRKLPLRFTSILGGLLNRWYC